MKILYNFTKKRISSITALLCCTLALMLNLQVNAQTYCTPTVTTSANYQCGISNVVLGTLTNNTGTPVPANFYTNFTAMSTTVHACSPVNYALTSGPGNNTNFVMWIDWNKDGTFNTSAPELITISGQWPPNSVYPGSFNIPVGTAAGSYRVRIAGDLNAAVPAPCLLNSTGDIEDYTLIVAAPTGTDIAMSGKLSPAYFSIGNNSLIVTVQNRGATTLTSATVGYQLQGSGAVTQAASFSLNPCASTNITLSSPLTLTNPGYYTLKMWATAPNGTFPDNVSTNDTVTTTICTPLNGVYTINASGSASNNYTSFNAAVTALSSCGISGPVVFNVTNATFSEQINIPAINGTSSTNTITFAGAGITSTLLTYGTQTPSAQHTVAFDGASWMRFRDMTIRSTNATYGWTVHFFGTNNANNSITNCKIECGGGGVTGTGTSFIPVLFNSSRTSYSNTTSATGNIIDSCNITGGGYAGLLFYGNGAATITGNQFRYNTFSGAYQYGAFFQSVPEVKFIGNTVSCRSTGTFTTGSIAVYLSSCNPPYPLFNDVSRNTIFDAGQFGIYLTSSTSTLGAKSLIANNMIGGGFTNVTASYGIYVNFSNYWNIFHNSINMDNSGFESFAINVNNSTSTFAVDVRNNMLQFTGTATSGWPLWAIDKSVFSDLDYNNYWKAGNSADLIYIGQPITRSLYKSTFNFNTNSSNIESPFASAKNLRTTNGCITALKVSQVPKDIDGDNRGFSTNVGADEFTNSVANDIGILLVTAPVSPVTLGATDVTVVLKNFGNNTVTSARISYTLNGASTKTMNWSGTLPACGELTLTFTGSDQVTIGPGMNVIRAFTSLPNGTTDLATVNDAASATVCPSMSGVFTINPNGSGASNFKSFTEAMDAINCSGLSGPVVVNVSAGTYNEQIVFRGISGLSATNTITFNGGDGNAATRILTFNNTQNTTRYTVLFDNISFITLKNLTIRNQSPNYGYNLFFYGATSDINIVKCRIDYTGGTGATSTSTNFVPVVFSNTLTSYSGTATFSRVKLDSNYINGAYACIYGNGNGNGSIDNVFTNNVMDNGFTYGIFMASLNGIILNNNTIINRANTSTSYAIFLSSINPNANFRSEVIGNKVSSPQHGIYLSSCSNNSTTTTGMVVNNMVIGGFTNASPFGIYVTSCTKWNFFFNSVNVDALVTGTTGQGAFYMTAGSLNDVRNNHFVLSHPSMNNANVFVINIVSGASTVDYNNYFKYGTTTNLMRVNNVVYSLATYKTAPGFNANSTFTNPDFVSPTDLHARNGCATGIAISGITTDYDGDIRNTPPTIGADEGVMLDAAALSIVAPTGTVVSGTQNVQFRIKNTGRTVITSMTAGYSLNGGTAVTQPWTGTLNPCDSVTVLFTGAQAASFGATGINVLAVFAQNPNGGVDQNSSNDSTSRTSCNGPLSGTYYINRASSAPNTFSSFTSFLASLNSCGMNGPITVNVANGTYTEQVLLTAGITGLAGRSIVFDGGDSSKTKIIFSAGNYTVRLDGADKITFRNIGIENTGTSNAFAVHLTNSADSNTFENCVITVLPSTTQTVIPFGIMGATITATTGGWGNMNTLQRSVISGGYANVVIYSSTAVKSNGNRVLDNIITNGNQYGLYCYYHNNLEIQGNSLSGLTGTSYGIYMQNCDAVKLRRNVLFNNNAQYGIYSSNLNTAAPAGVRSIVENNMVGGMIYPSTTTYGMFFQSSSNTDFYHNTSLMTNTAATGSRAAHFAAGTGNNLKNNIFANEVSNGFAYSGDFTGFTSFNYNNFYSSGSYLAFIGVNISDLAGLKSANATFNVNTVSVNPNFVSKNLIAPDLHLTSTAAAVFGDVTVPTTVDIDGDPRCTIAKTIGADESKYVEPISVQFTAPDTVYINSNFSVINAATAGTPKSFQWDFGNNGSVDATTIHANHIFTSAGVKEIKLRAISCTGIDSMIKTLVVVSPTLAPEADFIADKYTILPFETISFQDLSTNGPTSWLWDVSPLDPSMITTPSNTDPNPKMTFGTAGVYTICLTSTNSVGSSAKECKVAYITVKAVNNMCIFPNQSQGASGEIYDSGGPVLGYTPNENCTFLIEPCATSVTLKFSQFVLGSTGASLRIYNGNNASAPLLGIYTNASGLPGGTNGLTANSGNMFLHWISGTSASVGAGYSATWTSVPNNNVIVTPGFTVADTAYEFSDVQFTNTSTGSGLNFDWDLDGDSFSDAVSTDATFNYPAPGKYYPTLTVSDACGNVLTKTDSIEIIIPPTAPVVDFKSDLTVVTTSDTVKFTDLSTFGPFSWNYTFNPATVTIVGGTARNPWVLFNAIGTYTVTLDADNNVGTGTMTKTNYISVVNVCQSGTTGLVPDLGINRVQLNEIDNFSPSGVTGYTSYFNSVAPAMFDAGGTYDITVSRNSNLNKMNRKVWIDYNADGDFNDPGEQIGSETSAQTLSWKLTFTVPTGAARGATRLRIGTAFGDSTNLPCGPNFYGEAEEYRVVISNDITPPLITLRGSNPVTIEIGSVYNDSGATAFDAVDGNLTGSIIATPNVNTSYSGTYTVKYNVMDNAGNKAVEVIRTVIVTKDLTSPSLTLNAPLVVTIPVFTSFIEPGYSATDNISGNVTSSVVVDKSQLDTARVGTYIVTYTAFDAENNPGIKTRTVHVVDVTPPQFVMNGANPLEIEVFSSFTDPGVIVSDNYDSVIFATSTSNLNMGVIGSYTIVYVAKDASGNITTVQRTVNVVDKTAPVLQVFADTIKVEVFGKLIAPLMVVTDNYDPQPVISIQGVYDLNVTGNYTIDYIATDNSGNQSLPHPVVIKVSDTQKPVITLKGPFLMTIARWSVFVDPGVDVDDNYDTGLVVVKGGNFLTTIEEGLSYITYNVTDKSGNVAEEVIRAVNVIESTTGLKNISGNIDMMVYPNPATENVTVELVNGSFSHGKIQIMNMLGKTVRTISPEDMSSRQQIATGDLAAGVYLLQVENRGEVSLKRFIISK
jgi:PKD repeat protein